MLAPKFIRFRHVLVGGRTHHSEAVFPDLPVTVGDRVLDVGCGFGDTAMKLGGIVGSTGHVTGVDCCDAFLAQAQQETAAAGLTNVDFLRADAEIELPDGSYDFVFARFGTMFFANPVAGLGNMRRALKTGGRMVHIVWRCREDNPRLSMAKDMVMRFLPAPGEDAQTCGPGPFSMANKATVRAMMKSAGFVDVKLHRVDAPVLVGKDAEDAIAFQLAIGPAGEVFREAGAVAEARRPEIEAALAEAIARQSKGTDGIVMPSSSWVISGVNPSFLNLNLTHGRKQMPPPNMKLTFDKPGRGRIYGSILETVGNTPMVRLGRLAEEAGCQAEILAKLEFFNPISSVKDRIAVAMIEAMEADGTIGPGSVIVEPTSGNTGVALASVCAAKGYRCILTMPDSFSVERRKLMKFFGAELALTPKAEGIGGAINKAKEIIAETPGAVMPWQFGNQANPEVHRRTTVEEIWRDTNGVVDAVIMGVGTGGTLTGVGEVLKAHNPDVKIVAMEPEASQVLAGGTHSPHMIQGIGAGFVPDILNTGIIDEIMPVGNDEAMETARRAAALEGIPAGISSGAALACAIKYAQREGMKGQTVVTVLPSCAERYLSTALFDGYGDD